MPKFPDFSGFWEFPKNWKVIPIIVPKSQKLGKFPASSNTDCCARDVEPVERSWQTKVENRGDPIPLKNATPAMGILAGVRSRTHWNIQRFQHPALYLSQITSDFLDLTIWLFWMVIYMGQMRSIFLLKNAISFAISWKRSWFCNWMPENSQRSQLHSTPTSEWLTSSRKVQVIYFSD